MAKSLLLSLVLAAVCATGAFAQGLQVYVSTDGRDYWSGKFDEPLENGQDGPFRTLERAVQWIASSRRDLSDIDGPLVVSIRGGFYVLGNTLVLEAIHSGTAESPTVFKAFEDEEVILSGGLRRAEWQGGPQGQWVLDLSRSPVVDTAFSSIYINGARRERQRLPSSGYFELIEPLSRSSFRFSKADLSEPLSDTSKVEVLILHTWSESRLYIESIDLEASVIELAGEPVWPLKGGDFGASGRFALENVALGSPVPGRWRLDREQRMLLYQPMQGETPEESEAIIPQLDRLIHLNGSPEEDQSVRHIVFDGLQFAHTNWSTPESGYAFAQSDLNVGAAIEAQWAEHVSFRNCQFRSTGGHGIAFGSGSRFNSIERCKFDDLGGGGVLLGYAGRGSWDSIKFDMQMDGALVSHNSVCDSSFSDGGNVHLSAPAVWIGNSPDNTVEHNEISGFFQNGISVGWTWGFERSLAQNNRIAFNRIHDVGQGVLSDLAGIYLLGPQQGTSVYANHISRIHAHSYGGWGLYADEGTSDVVFEQNLVHDTSSGSFHQHYGADNVIRNNILAFSGRSPIEETRVRSRVPFRLISNILYWSGEQPVFGRCHTSGGCEPRFQANRNIYWGFLAEPEFPGQSSLDMWRSVSGQDWLSIVADPYFADPANRDFSLTERSPPAAWEQAATEYRLAGPRAPEDHSVKLVCGREPSK